MQYLRFATDTAPYYQNECSYRVGTNGNNTRFSSTWATESTWCQMRRWSPFGTAKSLVLRSGGHWPIRTPCQVCKSTFQQCRPCDWLPRRYIAWTRGTASKNMTPTTTNDPNSPVFASLKSSNMSRTLIPCSKLLHSSWILQQVVYLFPSWIGPCNCICWPLSLPNMSCVIYHPAKQGKIGINLYRPSNSMTKCV